MAKKTRPTPPPKPRRPIILLPLILLCFLLGVWQVTRLVQKNNLISTQLANQSAPPTRWYKDATLNADNRGKKFVITGRALTNQVFYLLSLFPDESERRGFEPIVPFITTDGELLVVSLGFLPQTKKTNITATDIQPLLQPFLQAVGRKQISLSVLADPIRKKGYFIPTNIIDSGIWFSLSPQELAQKWNLPILANRKSTNQFLFKTAAIMGVVDNDPTETDSTMLSKKDEKELNTKIKKAIAEITHNKLSVTSNTLTKKELAQQQRANQQAPQKSAKAEANDARLLKNPPVQLFTTGLPLPYNHHLEYIITWWALAICGLLLYLFGKQGKNDNITRNNKNRPA
ncbi:MAG: SURF1 family protein [Alphaproteobacteria bacterium]|nr:SURF1 family protein [Alphaproteobacteria bacterium]